MTPTLLRRKFGHAEPFCSQIKKKERWYTRQYCPSWRNCQLWMDSVFNWYLYGYEVFLVSLTAVRDKIHVVTKSLIITCDRTVKRSCGHWPSRCGNVSARSGTKSGRTTAGGTVRRKGPSRLGPSQPLGGHRTRTAGPHGLASWVVTRGHLAERCIGK